MRNKTPFISNSGEWLPICEALIGPSIDHCSLLRLHQCAMSHLGIKQTPSLREGGGASEPALEWLQLNQNKERLIERWVLWKVWAEAIKQKDFQHLHQWHLSEQIFYCVLQLLITAKALHRKTIQMLTGKTAFPYQSYQWRLRIGHLVTVLNVREAPGVRGPRRSHSSCLRVFFVTALVNSCKLWFLLFKGPDSLFIDVNWMTSIDFGRHCISP